MGRMLNITKTCDESDPPTHFSSLKAAEMAIQKADFCWIEPNPSKLSLVYPEARQTIASVRKFWTCRRDLDHDRHTGNFDNFDGVIYALEAPEDGLARVAAHECGHLLAAAWCQRESPTTHQALRFSWITILPIPCLSFSGGSVGSCNDRKKGQISYRLDSVEDFVEELVIQWAGEVAEEIIYGTGVFSRSDGDQANISQICQLYSDRFSACSGDDLKTEARLKAAEFLQEHEAQLRFLIDRVLKEFTLNSNRIFELLFKTSNRTVHLE